MKIHSIKRSDEQKRRQAIARKVAKSVSFASKDLAAKKAPSKDRVEYVRRVMSKALLALPQ